MTTLPAAALRGVNRPSQIPRTGNTLRLRWLMDQAQREEMAERIRELRERSPFTQPQIAEKLGIGLRAYQKLEAQGTTKWERCEELAEIHTADFSAEKVAEIHGHPVTAAWIWDGSIRAGTPDLMAELGKNGRSQLDQIETKLDAILNAVDPDALAEIVAETEQDLDAALGPDDETAERTPSASESREAAG